MNEIQKRLKQLENRPGLVSLVTANDESSSVLQAATILVAMASGNKIWRLSFPHVTNLATSVMQRAGHASTFFFAVQSLSQTNLITEFFIITISIAYLTYLFELRIPHCSDS